MFPIGSMYYFGSPDFFEKYVKHLKFWPDEEKTNRPPVERDDIKQALADLKQQRMARRQQVVKGDADVNRDASA
jgi:protein PET100